MDKKYSKFLSLILRHKPEVLDLKLDAEGWVNTKELVNGMKSHFKDFKLSDLERVVENCEKQRYTFNENKSKIRASQGHSLMVDLKLREILPPPVLYHGTAAKYLDSIYKLGLIPGKRQHVHLSPDMQTAAKVGARHGKAVIITLDTQFMSLDGIKFYMSENRVWLVDHVDPKYFVSVVGV